MRPIALSAVALLLAAAALPPAATAVGPGALPERAAAIDRDGDHIADGLEHRLARADAGTATPVLVTLAAASSSGHIAQLERGAGELRVDRSHRLVDAVGGTADERAIRRLSRRDDVLRIDLDARVHAASDTAAEWFGVDRARAHDATLDGAAESGEGLTAAVIDSGVDDRHTDLGDGKVVASLDCTTSAAGCVPAAPSDAHGHGTHVAGTIAGRRGGVAPEARIVSLKVLDAAGSGDASDVVEAIEWVVGHEEHGIDVLNLSLATDECADGRDALSTAVDRAAAHGIVTVVAAGNTGPAPCTIGSPAAAERAITVAAMADPGDLPVPGFGLLATSSRGPTADGRVKPDVSAPGMAIRSAVPCADAPACDTLGGRTGSSMAAGFVSGLALLLLDARPQLTPDAVKRLVTATAVDWGAGGPAQPLDAGGPDADHGAGRLDAYAALRAAGGADLHAPPAVPSHVVHRGTLRPTDETLDVPVHVANPAFPVAATLLAEPQPGRRPVAFDIALLGPDGTEVAAGATSGRQAQVGAVPAGAGDYIVRITRRAGAGRFVLDVSAGLDGSPPDTSVAGAPPPVITARSVAVELASSEAGGHFECRLDSIVWRACPARAAFDGLAPGLHVLDVRAVDAEGNADVTPSTLTWHVLSAEAGGPGAGGGDPPPDPSRTPAPPQGVARAPGARLTPVAAPPRPAPPARTRTRTRRTGPAAGRCARAPRARRARCVRAACGRLRGRARRRCARHVGGPRRAPAAQRPVRSRANRGSGRR